MSKDRDRQAREATEPQETSRLRKVSSRVVEGVSGVTALAVAAVAKADEFGEAQVVQMPNDGDTLRGSFGMDPDGTARWWSDTQTSDGRINENASTIVFNPDGTITLIGPVVQTDAGNVWGSTPNSRLSVGDYTFFTPPPGGGFWRRDNTTGNEVGFAGAGAIGNGTNNLVVLCDPGSGPDCEAVRSEESRLPVQIGGTNDPAGVGENLPEFDRFGFVHSVEFNHSGDTVAVTSSGSFNGRRTTRLHPCDPDTVERDESGIAIRPPQCDLSTTIRSFEHTGLGVFEPRFLPPQPDGAGGFVEHVVMTRNNTDFISSFQTIPASAVEDTDADGRIDGWDNCPAVANADQADSDTDRFGDVCDPCPEDQGNTDHPYGDLDSDTVCAGPVSDTGIAMGLRGEDNCPEVANSDQANMDAFRPGGDALGDVCDDDREADGILDADESAACYRSDCEQCVISSQVCVQCVVNTSNPAPASGEFAGQMVDTDHDGLVDACDRDLGYEHQQDGVHWTGNVRLSQMDSDHPIAEVHPGMTRQTILEITQGHPGSSVGILIRAPDPKPVMPDPGEGFQWQFEARVTVDVIQGGDCTYSVGEVCVAEGETYTYSQNLDEAFSAGIEGSHVRVTISQARPVKTAITGTGEDGGTVPVPVEDAGTPIGMPDGSANVIPAADAGPGNPGNPDGQNHPVIDSGSPGPGPAPADASISVPGNPKEDPGCLGCNQPHDGGGALNPLTIALLTAAAIKGARRRGKRMRI